MKRTPTQPELSHFPAEFHRLMAGTQVYDSSCSPTARVWYLETDGGLYLKSAPKGMLKQEADMDAFYHSLQLGPEVLSYQSGEKDWLLTRAVPGEDCTHAAYLAEPKRLAETMGHLLYHLHHQNHAACPVQDHTERYICTAVENYAARRYDASLFPDNWGYATPEEAWAVIQANRQYLKQDTLLHGDYCLPNIMLDNWRFSGFIDLGGGGVGDKHVDLFWGTWSLNFNLKTDAYRARFLDAYGRENCEEEMFRVIAAFEVFA